MTMKLWEMDIPEISPRSQLYGLAPLGINTPLVESLTSYICRLAGEHHVQTGILIQHSIAPIIAKQYIADGSSRAISSFLRYADPINGNGVMASDWSRALGVLTLDNNLSRLTLLAATDALSHRDLLQPANQWCPMCYDEWRHQGTTVYSPLLWSINGVTVCPKHHQLLERVCPRCSSCLPWLSWNSRPGYCSACERWLGSSACHVQPEEKDIYISKMVMNFLAYSSSSTNPIPKAAFVQSFKDLISTTTQGNIAAFSRTLGLPKTTVWELAQGRFPPSILFLFQLCFQFQSPLLQLLTGMQDIVPINISFEKEEVRKKSSCHSFDHMKARQGLEDILGDSQCASFSMREVARKLGYHARTITTHFPEEARRISQRYLDYRRQQGALRREHLKQRIDEAVFIVNDQGQLPTFRRVGAVLNAPGSFREAEARQAFFDAQQKTGVN